MFENCRNIFLDYIDDIKDDFYHSSKKIQAGTCYDIKEPNSGTHTLKTSHEMKLNMPWCSQFLMSESTWIFASQLYYKKQYLWNKVGNSTLDNCYHIKQYILVAKSKEPNLVIDIIQSISNVRKHLNILSLPISDMIDDICHSSKWILPGTIVITWNSDFWWQNLRKTCQPLALTTFPIPLVM